MADAIGRAFIVVAAELWPLLNLDESAPDFLYALGSKLLIHQVGFVAVSVDRDDPRGVIVTIEGPGIPMNEDGTMREAAVTYGHDPERDVHWLKGVRIMCPAHTPE